MADSMSGGTLGERPLVFLSYSRKDAKWRDRFLLMLAPVLERDPEERELEVRSDQREVVGERWRSQLEQAIGRSRAALLLVSPDFLLASGVEPQTLQTMLGHTEITTTERYTELPGAA
jgi:hypothetical protein